MIIIVVPGDDCSSGLGFSPKSQMMVINPKKCLTPTKLEEVLLEGIGVDSEHREGGKGLGNVKKIYKCEGWKKFIPHCKESINIYLVNFIWLISNDVQHTKEDDGLLAGYICFVIETIRLRNQQQLTPIAPVNLNQTCTRNRFFGRFLLILDQIKRSKVIPMGKFGPTALNFC